MPRLAIFVMLLIGLAATGGAAAQSVGDAVADSPTVTVDWWAQVVAGGWTMVALGALSLALVAFIVERALTVRAGRFCPKGLVDRALPLIARRDWAGALKLAEASDSTMGRIIAFAVSHRKNPYEKLAAVVADLGSRDIVDQEERTSPLAVIAGVAPLLGLLGTMIGMIEAFQLVSLYGDEGGASLLAGSIAKALITTAVGLILAIPALVAYHYFRRRVHRIAVTLDAETERFLTGIFFKRSEATTPQRDEDGEDADEVNKDDGATTQAARRPAATATV